MYRTCHASGSASVRKPARRLSQWFELQRADRRTDTPTVYDPRSGLKHVFATTQAHRLPPRDIDHQWTLDEFTEPSSVDARYMQTGTVMGGVSSISLMFDARTMALPGALSTDNNGGFTSGRGPMLKVAPAVE